MQLALLLRLTRRTKAAPEEFHRYLLERESFAARLFRDSHHPDRLFVLQSCRDHLAAILENLSGEPALARAEARYHGLKADMLELACGAPMDKSMMHELRIIAKQTHYTFEIVNSCLSRLRSEWEFVRRMRHMHGLLGDWHDHEVAFEYLDRFLEERGSRGLDLSLARLAERLRRDRDRLRERSLTEINRIRSMVVPPAEDRTSPPPEGNSNPVKAQPVNLSAGGPGGGPPPLAKGD